MGAHAGGAPGGAREVGFTVISMSLSLIAVFIPILLMSGMVGRLFREFAVTLSAAVVISLVVSLTATPDDVRLRMIKEKADKPQTGPIAAFGRWFDLRASTAFLRSYEGTQPAAGRSTTGGSCCGPGRVIVLSV